MLGQSSDLGQEVKREDLTPFSFCVVPVFGARAEGRQGTPMNL